jgi:tRNA(fMet)-specific endonuclease VapC
VIGLLDFSRYPILHSDAATVRRYAQIHADLRRRNDLIGPNDLWIAACALANDLPLLTRNIGQFSRVDGLQVIDYTAGHGEAPDGP